MKYLGIGFLVLLISVAFVLLLTLGFYIYDKLVKNIDE